jgi:hypothetical protein
MQQHPVPQHIASYEFRLVGDMTIRQFGLLAGCCLVALLFYASGLPSYFKWPAVIFFVLMGIALAFIPIEERPMHQWLVAFFKAVYSPTRFLWAKEPKKIDLFATAAKAPKEEAEAKVAPSDQGQLQRYLSSLPRKEAPLEKKERDFLNKVSAFYQGKTLAVAPIPATPSSLPPVPSRAPAVMPKPVDVWERPLPKPPSKPLKIKPTPEKKKPKVEAITSQSLPFPQVPQTPNLLVGMVLDKGGKIIENAIIEIRNKKGIPVRALKSNKLGQFRIVTPLKNDQYEIETEREGYTFDIIKVELKGKPVKPIEIRAK